MKYAGALGVILTAIGAGLLASGTIVVGVGLIVVGLVIVGTVTVAIVRLARENSVPFRRSALADEPAFRSRFRRTGGAVVGLGALPLLGAAAVLIVFAAMVTDPDSPPGPRGAAVVFGLLLAGIPASLGARLLSHGRRLLRGDPASAPVAIGLCVTILVFAVLAALGAITDGRTDVSYNRLWVIVGGLGIAVACIVVIGLCRKLLHGVQDAEQQRAQQTSGPAGYR